MWHQTIVVGNVGREPEMRYTPAGQPVTGFSTAVNERFVNSQGEKVERVIWYNVQAWGKLAEVCHRYIHKGMRVMVIGRLVADPQTGMPRVWQKKDGTSGASFELRAGEVKFLSKINNDGMNQDDSTEDVDQTPAQDDIPF